VLEEAEFGGDDRLDRDLLDRAASLDEDAPG
jgi:hypothetical protein